MSRQEALLFDLFPPKVAGSVSVIDQMRRDKM